MRGCPVPSTRDLTDVAFRVSSYSGETGQCVAVAATDGDE